MFFCRARRARPVHIGIELIRNPCNADSLKFFHVLFGHALKLIAILMTKELAESFKRSSQNFGHFVAALFMIAQIARGRTRVLNYMRVGITFTFDSGGTPEGSNAKSQYDCD